MSDTPFGFGPPDPDDPDRKGGQGGNPGSGGQENPFEAFSQLGDMLSQLGQMLSQAGQTDGPVNYDIAKQIAVQKLGGAGFTGDPDPGGAVADAVHLAEMWLDPVTTLPVGATTTKAWSPREWVDSTLPTWRRLCDPVAKRVSGAWVEALPAEAKEAAGPLLSMVGQMGGMAFGSQLGNALGQLAGEVVTSTDIGLPLGPENTAALVPANIEALTKGLERPSSEVMVFLAAREAAHQRLFAHVPWLRQRLLATVEEFAHGIKVDTDALQQLTADIDPTNPESLERAMQSGMLEPQTTPEQQAALTRLETLLALVEGWVDVVVGDAVTDRLPGAEALRETLRRRRASGGPAEQTFATLVGLELRPRKMRAAAALWRLVGDQQGIEARDGLWAHPDLMPTADDLDDPLEFAERLGATPQLEDDPLAQLRQTEERERAAREQASAGDATDATDATDADAKDAKDATDADDSEGSSDEPDGKSS